MSSQFAFLNCVEFHPTGFSYTWDYLDFSEVANMAIVKRTNRVEDFFPMQRLVGGREYKKKVSESTFTKLIDQHSQSDNDLLKLTVLTDQTLYICCFLNILVFKTNMFYRRLSS